MLSFFAKDQNKIFRRMGYLKDQKGIMERYLREAGPWKQHLENTKTFILHSANNKEKNKAAVLGSGWLLDVPVVELSQMFKQVWLFDIKHPIQIKRRVEKLANVKLIETDISGFAALIYEIAQSVKKAPLAYRISDVTPKFDFNLSDFDFVVSCNVLNQLDIILIDYLKQKCQMPYTVETQLRKLIQDTHINLLPKSKSCLVSDMEELSFDNQHKFLHSKSLVYTDIISSGTTEKWVWQFDNHFTYKPDTNTWFNVVAANL
jgi:hypothetical protein